MSHQTNVQCRKYGSLLAALATMLLVCATQTSAQTGLPASASGNLAVHLKADAGVTTDANGISSWADQSTSVAGANDASRIYLAGPTLTNINGRTMVNIPADRGLTISGTTADLGMNDGDYEMFVVGRTTAPGEFSSSIRFLVAGNVEAHYEIHFGEAVGAKFIPNGYNPYIGHLANSADIDITGNYTKGLVHVVNARVEKDESNITYGYYGYIAVDGVQSLDTMANPRSTQVTTLDLGERGSNGHGDLDGQIGEVLIYNRALTMLERQQVTAYLTARWQDVVQVARGGSTTVPTNLALQNGATAFAKDLIANGAYAPTHTIANLNDGLYGNAKSWIGNSASTFAGINLSNNGTKFRIDSIAWGRDNTSGYRDRTFGTYTIQYTTNSTPSATTPDSEWTDLFGVTYLGGTYPYYLRHKYQLVNPVVATGIRIKMGASGDLICIDEIEVTGAVACLDDHDGDGICNDDDGDNCPNVANADQLDYDQDDIGAACDLCDDDDTNDVDGDLLCGGSDNCPTVPNANQLNNDGDSQGDACDLDDDNDGVPDTTDNCPLVANADQADVLAGGNGVGDVCDNDYDGDGTANLTDACPLDKFNDVDGDGVCGNVDNCPLDKLNDDDDDGVCGNVDNCPTVANCADVQSCQSDGDGDGTGDLCDNCPGTANDDQANADVLAESADSEDDLLILGDACDNCPNVANNQANNDSDGQGDACDTDDDNDSVPDTADNCPTVSNSTQSDFDGNDVGDACEQDADGDLVGDANDLCPGTPIGATVDTDGCRNAGYVDQVCPCSGSWKNHGAYVSCVANTADALLGAGEITSAEKDAIVSTAAKKGCGKKK